MKVLVIGNPAAGAGRAAAAAARLIERLRACGHTALWFATRARGDARRQARRCEGEVDCIVTAGGDGTLNEVLNGLADPRATPLLPLWLGTANMLARELGVPRDPTALTHVIERGAVRRIDLCHCGDTRFLSVAGVGFDALVTETIRRTRRGPLGYPGYAAPILKALARYRAPRLAVRLDGGAPEAAGFVIAGKLANYGGVMHVTPEAQPDSGAFDVCLFRRARVPDLFGFVLPAFRGRLAARPGVSIRCAAELHVEADGAAPVQLDGDYWGTTPVTLTLEPAVVPILVPSGRVRKATPSG